MTRDEFRNIVSRFNRDKVKNKWVSLLDLGTNCGWERYKSKVPNFPIYYNFKDAQEFRFWLVHSEDRDFIDKRFCPICGGFIVNKISKSYVYPSGCSKECIIKIKAIHKKETVAKKVREEQKVVKVVKEKVKKVVSNKKERLVSGSNLEFFVSSVINDKKDMLQLIEKAYPDVVLKYRSSEYPFIPTCYFPFTMSDKDYTPERGVYFEYYIDEGRVDDIRDKLASEKNLKWYRLVGLEEFKKKWDREDLFYDGTDEVLMNVWKMFYANELNWWKNPDNRLKLYNNRYRHLGKTFLELTNAEILRAIGSIARFVPYYSRFDRGKKIMKQLITKDDIVYDPFGGWGDRFICARDIGCKYYYNDLNPELAKLFNGTCEDGFLYKPEINEYVIFSCPPYIINGKMVEKYAVETPFNWDTFFNIHSSHKIILVLPEAMEKDVPQYDEKIPLNQTKTHFNHTNKKTAEFAYIWYPKK